jgi:DNA-binding XRE family transcriptional regulator
MRLKCHLSEALQKADMTQAELARRIGGHQPDVSDWCNSKCQPPGRTMIQIAKLLGTTVESLWKPERGRPYKSR